MQAHSSPLSLVARLHWCCTNCSHSRTVNKIQENMLGQLMETGRTVWGPKVPTLKGTEASLSYVQCFLYLVSSSINVSIFHVTWLDTFWTDYIYGYIWIYMTHTDRDNSMVITRGKGGLGRGKRTEGGGKETSLWLLANNAQCRWCFIELYTWNLYSFINQWHPNKFNWNIYCICLRIFVMNICLI